MKCLVFYFVDAYPGKLLIDKFEYWTLFGSIVVGIKFKFDSLVRGDSQEWKY